MMGILENLALVIIVFGFVKMFVILISPKSWIKFAKGIYKNPNVTKIISLILAGVVLYNLINAGIGIVEILAVMVFIALMMIVGLATYMPDILRSLKNPFKLIKEQWLYALIWVLLLLWGAWEIFS